MQEARGDVPDLRKAFAAVEGEGRRILGGDGKLDLPEATVPGMGRDGSEEGAGNASAAFGGGAGRP